YDAETPDGGHRQRGQGIAGTGGGRSHTQTGHRQRAGRCVCARRLALCVRWGGTLMFTSTDYDKFRALRVTHVATRFEELILDEANDECTPEQLFLTAVDDALEQRRINRIDKLIHRAKFPIPHATITEIDCR